MRFALLVLLFAGSFVAAEEPKSWKGQKVVGKKPAEDIKFGDWIDGKEVYFPFEGHYPITVRDDKDGWLRLFDGHKEGWAVKDDFVLSRDAPAYFTDRIRANPNDDFAYQMRGHGWYDRGDYDNALKDYTECIRINPRAAAYFNSRGTAWAKKKDYDKAIRDYDEAIRLDPKYASAFYNRGNAWADKQEYDKAIRDYDEAIRLDPKFAAAFYNRGVAWDDKKEYDKAIRDYDEAIRLDPKYATAFHNRGTAWHDKKEYDKAIRDYDEAIRLDPKYALAFNNRGWAWANKKEYDKAIRDYDEAIRLDPKYALSYSNRSVALMLTRKPAVEGFRRVLEVQGWKGDRAVYAVILGHFAARLEKDEQAAAKFLKDSAGKLDEAWPYPSVQYLRGEIDEETLLKLATDDDKRTQARCYLGLDHLVKGNRDKALAHFRWVKEKGTVDYDEYTIAVAELERLENAK
jgi:tetratricopeptide (TPR) repeat protein